MSTDNTPGARTKLSINGTAMAALDCGLGKREVLISRPGLRGTRAHFDTDVRKASQYVAGSITLNPSHSELVALAALAIGSGGAAAEALNTFSVVVDRFTQVDTYAGCKINRFTLAGSQGQPLILTLDIIGTTEAANSGSVSAPNSGIPYIMSDLTLTLQSSARAAFSFSLVIDNMIDAERFLNSVTLSDLVEQDRSVTLQTVHPFSTANLDLYDQAVGGAAGSLALNNGTSGGAFSFGRLQCPAERPEIPGKTEVNMTLNMIATKVSGTAAGTTDDIAYAED